MKTTERRLRPRPSRFASSSRRWPCASGKRRYRDHQEAIVALQGIAAKRGAALSENGSTRRREVRAYECTHCHGHHLTSQP